MTTAVTLSPSKTVAPDERTQLDTVVHGGELGAFRAFSDVAACLVPLLQAIGWHGSPRALQEALPHFADTLDIEGMRGVLANLNYASEGLSTALTDLDPRLLPCLFIPRDKPAMVLLERDDAEFTIFDGGTGETSKTTGKGVRGTAYIIRPIETEADTGATSPRNEDWTVSVGRRFRRLVLQMFAITFISSLLALLVPVFIMAVYDQVIPSRSTATLLYLGAGILFALAIDAALRLIRARILAYIGGRTDMIMGTHAFVQVLNLPVSMTERAPIGAQVSRLKQFEAVRDFFTGPLAGVFLELPFVALFIAVIAAIAGPLAWIPVILIALFVLCAAVMLPTMHRLVGRTSDARARRHGFVVEMLSNLRTVKNCNAEAVWSRRHRDLSARCAMANFHSAQMSVLAQSIAHFLMLGAGIATLALGTMRVLDEQMTIGALVASMALIWRVLAPLQTGYLSLTRLEQVKQGLRQMNQLMKLKPEREPGATVDQYRRFRGEIALSRVSFRYTPNGEPALLGVDLAIAPNQIIAITGPNGSGKSSLLKVVAGLYRPQAGAVLIDGIHIRQLDCAELRHAIAYLPQVRHLFHGTIEQNLRLANPIASDAMLADAARDASLLDDINALPEGFDTRLTERLQHQLSAGFMQRLMLARAYVKDAPIYLLDEPGRNLDSEGDAQLMRKLDDLRRTATVLMVTQRPSYMHLADKVICLDAGRIVAAGTPGEILPGLGSD